MAPRIAPSGTVVFSTDFGTKDGAVAAMKGVALGVDPLLRLEDLTHEIPPFDVWTGAYWLRQAAPFWPAATVFVCVVDPGVGTERAPIAMRTRSGHLLVGPDNGVLALAADALGLESVRVIDEARHRRAGSQSSATFHGRDLFAVVGAGLASGRLALADVGPALAREPVRLPHAAAAFAAGVVRGTIEIHDPNYGNLWTNVDRATFARLGLQPGQRARVRIREGDRVAFTGDVTYATTFGDVAEGAPLLYLNSLDRLALALNLGNFATTHAIGFGPSWSVEVARAD